MHHGQSYNGEVSIRLCTTDSLQVEISHKAAHQNTIELCSDEGQTGLIGGLCKGLVLHCQGPEGQSVLTEEARQRARPILDGKLSSVCLQEHAEESVQAATRLADNQQRISFEHSCTHLIVIRLGGVILVVQVTGDLQPAALAGGDPEVAAASIKNDFEVLRGSAEAHYSIILQEISRPI